MNKVIIFILIVTLILTSVIASSCSDPSWELHLVGATTENISDGAFADGARPNCHGTSWEDSDDHTWYGIPLWLLVGRVDDDNKHKINAFNDQLADAGYQVKVVTADGNSTLLHSSTFKSNNKIIVANSVDSGPLDNSYWPLRLVGAGLEEQQMLGQIVRI